MMLSTEVVQPPPSSPAMLRAMRRAALAAVVLLMVARASGQTGSSGGASSCWENSGGAAADVDGDNAITTADLLLLLQNYGCLSDCCDGCDANGDGQINVIEILNVLAWFNVVNSCYRTQATDANMQLPPVNLSAAGQNPLKGMVPNPFWSAPPYLQTVPSTLEFFYVELSQVMNGMNSFDGFATFLEPKLAAMATRSKHAIIRFILDYPGHENTYVPQFLLEGNCNELRCGRADSCSEQRWCATHDELHEVRCCADSAASGFHQYSPSSCPNVWADSDTGSNCQHGLTLAEAAEFCEGLGGRLCTAAEVEADCTAGTGCGHDSDLIWTSTPYQDEVLHYGENCWMDCGQQQGPCNWCGSGYCCRHGHGDTSNGCDGTVGIEGQPDHVCVANPTPPGSITMTRYDNLGGGMSPNYADLHLIAALESFIAEFGRRYDADPRIGFVQVGLLGYWGEWHTWPNDWIPNETKEAVVAAFGTAFQQTQVQVRYPFSSATDRGFGLHDDSFAYSTLDGEPNGGIDVDWFFWPKVVQAGADNLWQTGVMGGELRPELQETVFNPDYPAGTEYHQDYTLCVEQTHATYMVNHYAFSTGYTGEALERAIDASNRMGYAFIVSAIDLEGPMVSVTITQRGVAPFYYLLNLTLSCESFSRSLPGVETIVAEGDNATFAFDSVPTTQECRSQVAISLASNMTYPDAPIVFAQGDDGSVVLDLTVGFSG